MYELNEEEFQASLPDTLSATIYLEVETMLELAMKIDALIGRSYLLPDEKEGYFISGIKGLSVQAVTEFYTMPDPGSTNAPIPHTAFHAIVLPIWEHFFPNIQEREEAKIVAD